MVQEKIIGAKAAYEKVVDDLQKVSDERTVLSKGDWLKVIVSSNKSYEEILHFIMDYALDKRGG